MQMHHSQIVIKITGSSYAGSDESLHIMQQCSKLVHWKIQLVKHKAACIICSWGYRAESEHRKASLPV